MKNFLFAFLLTVFSFAIDVHIAKEKNISQNVSREEINGIQDYFYELFHFHMSERGAKKLLKENRALANEYLKKYGLSSYDKNRIKVITELYLANKFVKQIQNKVKLDDDEILSYYLDHKDEYLQPNTVDFVAFVFDTPENAMKFYEKNKKTSMKKLIKIAKQNHAIIKEYKKRSIKKLKADLRYLVNKYQHGLLPPLIGKKSSVIYIESFDKKKKYKSFNEVRKEIEKILKNKKFLDERQRIVKKYNKSIINEN